MTDTLMQKLPDVRGKYLFSEPLKNHTWLNVGGPADVMFIPEDMADLQYFLQNNTLPVFILGGGSNLLIRDGGWRGAVIKLSHKNFCSCQIEDNLIRCGSGYKNNLFKKVLPQYRLGGLEFLCSIPGTIGGAVKGNAGCFGSEISQVLHDAVALDAKGQVHHLTNQDFNFAYRHSDFPADWIITEVSLNAQKGDAETIKMIIAQNDEYRRTHQPQGIRTAGSTFKNPQGYRAWELIKNAGGAEMIVGGAQMSKQHCNFLENDGTATAADIENLGKQIIQAVKRQSGVTLEWEIMRIGQEL